jgi:hypothetical protein
MSAASMIVNTYVNRCFCCDLLFILICLMCFVVTMDVDVDGGVDGDVDGYVLS